MGDEIRGNIGLFDRRLAIFSPCRKYRYLLESVWDGDAGIVTFVMLNPSTADETNEDPTNTRCRRYVEAWGLGGLRFVNLFAYRAVDPRDMKAAQDPIGPGNDEAIVTACLGAKMIVCAWGSHGQHLSREATVTELLREFPLHVLRLNRGGSPTHPLYLPRALRPQSWAQKKPPAGAGG